MAAERKVSEFRRCTRRLLSEHGVQAENLLQQTALGLQSCDSHGNSGGSSEQDDGHTGSSGIR